jgi:hypothetical protein
MRLFLIVIAGFVWLNAHAQPNPAPKAKHHFIVIAHLERIYQRNGCHSNGNEFARLAGCPKQGRRTADLGSGYSQRLNGFTNRPPGNFGGIFKRKGNKIMSVGFKLI